MAKDISTESDSELVQLYTRQLEIKENQLKHEREVHAQQLIEKENTHSIALGQKDAIIEHWIAKYNDISGGTVLAEKDAVIERNASEKAEMKLRIQELQDEIGVHSGITTQMRIIQLKKERLGYIAKFTDEHFRVTRTKKLAKPIEWLARDFLANELLEEINERVLTVAKVAFQQKRFDLTVDRLIKVGIYCSDRYMVEYDCRPPKFPRFVNGDSTVEVNYYTERDRWIIEDALKRDWGDHINLDV